jgi:hypothetical protein
MQPTYSRLEPKSPSNLTDCFGMATTLAQTFASPTVSRIGTEHLAHSGVLCES